MLNGWEWPDQHRANQISSAATRTSKVQSVPARVDLESRDSPSSKTLPAVGK